MRGDRSCSCPRRRQLVLRAGVDEFVGPVRGQRPGDGGPTVLDGLRARAVDVEGRVGGAVGYGELHKDAGPVAPPARIPPAQRFFAAVAAAVEQVA